MRGMATFVFFHAHPDDETMSTGGTMARAHAEGHRVVLVTATRGEHGEVAEGVLQPGEALAERREAEIEAAAMILGVNRGEFLGYVDSGMAGVAENDAPESFWRADVDEAAGRLAAILEEEQPDVFTIYDEHGQYGHPDHIQVHRVGARAAELAGVKRVYQATINRDHIARLMEQAAESGLDAGSTEGRPTEPFGMPESTITTVVDIRPWVELKRRAMAAHASQIPSDSFFMTLPDEAFATAFGTEWFIRQGAPEGTRESWLLEDQA
jgi:LmbE family N-acetylglucosaminyl deacetylase